jgi:exopolysaccharide production protein ExoZ
VGKLRSIQVLRAIAVIAVVYCHAFATGRGSAGVDLFFVISGFIIARVSRDRPAREFANARFWRIYPIYLLAVLPSVLWQFRFGSGLTQRVAATLTLWPIWGGEYQQPLLPVAWSLYFEVLFYLAITTWLFSRRAALAAAAGVAILALLDPGPASAFLLSPIILEFIAGYGLARVQRFHLAAPALVLGCLLLFCSARQFEAATMLDPMANSLRALLFGVPAVMTVYGALGLERVFRSRWADPLVWIGDASYSIYLIHLYPLNALAGSSPAMPAIRFAAGLAVGLVVYRLLERPLGAVIAQRRKRLNLPRASVITALASPIAANAPLTSAR